MTDLSLMQPTRAQRRAGARMGSPLPELLFACEARPQRSRKQSGDGLRFRRHGHHTLVFKGDRLVKCLTRISGGQDKTVRVRLEAIVGQYQAAMASATASTRAFGANVLSTAQNNSAAFTTMGLAAVALGGVMVLGLKRAVSAAIEFEATTTKMITQIGLTRAEIDHLAQAALNLGHTGKGPQELAEALFFITSAGLRGAEALAVLEASAKASAIGLGTTAQVADVVTSAVNAYGSEILSASAATDVLVGAVREGKAEAPALAGAFGKVLPIASEMEISFNDVGAAIAAMTRTGTEASQASTQLRSIMVSLLKPTKQAEEAMRGLGLSSAGLRRTIREDGLWAALTELKDAVGDNDTAMAKIFPNVRALAGVLDLTGANAEATAEIFDRMGNVVGLTETAFEQWSKTTQAAGARFSAAMESASIAVGTVLLPAVTGMLNVGTSFVSFFTSLPGPIRTVAVALMGITSVALLFGGALLLLLPRIAMTTAALGTLNISLAGTAAALRAFALNPYVLAITAAITAVTAFSQAKARAQERVESFTQAIDADSGALGENTRATAVANLEKEGLLEIADKAGIALNLLTDSVLGNAEAQTTLAAEIQASVAAGEMSEAQAFRMMKVLQEQEGAVEGARDAIRRKGQEAALAAREEAALTDETERMKRAMEESRGPIDAVTAALIADKRAASDLSTASGDLGSMLDLLSDEMDDVKTSADALSLALDHLFGNTIDVEKAKLAFRDSLAKLREQLSSNTKGLDLNSDAGRDNRKATLAAIEAAFGLATTVHEQTGSVDKATEAFGRHIGQLIGVAKEAGLTRKEVRDYLTELGRTPEDIKTVLSLLGLDKASHEISKHQSQLDAIPRQITTTLTVVSADVGHAHRSRRGHSGGFAQDLAWTRMHAGSPVLTGRSFPSLRSDEVPAVLQTGELVLSRSQVATFRDLLASLPRFHDGGRVPATPAPVGGDGPLEFHITDWSKGVGYITGKAVDRLDRAVRRRL